MDWKRGALRGKHPPFFLPAFAAGEATFHEAASFFAGDTTVTVVFERGGSPRCATRGGLFLAAESTSFRIINSPVTDISRPGWWGQERVRGESNSIILCRVGFDPIVCWFFLEFFGCISIDYFVKIFFFTNVSFFEEVGAMRCELDRFRFHVSFNVFCSVRVIDDL